MRITTYIQATLFLAVGVRVFWAWLQSKELRQGHLAIATGLFGINSLISAVNATIWQSSKGEFPPRALSIVSGIIIWISVYAFLLFLSDFIRFPRWIHGFLIVATLVNIVFSIIERPDLRIAGDPPMLQRIPGVDNPIPYSVYVQIILVYLAIVFGALAVSFMVYGMRLERIAKFRMLSIGLGFGLLCVAIGLIPRLLIGRPPTGTIQTVSDIVRYLALASAPLLLMGFAPPRALIRRWQAS